MSNLNSLEKLMIKQTCRFFAYKFEMDSDSHSQSTEEDSTSIYSLQFLKSLYDSPKDNINRVTKSALLLKNNAAEANKETDEKCYLIEKVILLDFFKKVVEMKSHPAKQWTDLQHYLCFIYRYCMTNYPDPEQEVLSPYFITDMKSIVSSLMKEDEIQLCLRLFSLVREYTTYAQKQHQQIPSLEKSIESLFYYYEAFLSATRNICQIFPELEKHLLNTYKLGWLDFNTSIFMYYFYETAYVQNIVHKFEQRMEKVSIKTRGIYTILTELHKLWRSQMLGINSVIAKKLGAKFKGLDSNIMAAHKKVLSKNFWMDRTSEEKERQDLALFDCQLFALVGNKKLSIPDVTLDDSGQCICEDCLIIKYTSLLEKNPSKVSAGCLKVSCRFCQEQIDLDHFQEHMNEGSHCKNSSTRCDVVECKKEALTNHNGDVDLEKLEAELDGNKLSRKTFYNLLKCGKSFTRAHKENICEAKKKAPEKSNGNVQKPVKLAQPKPKESNFSKSNSKSFPCGHSCKLEEELKSEFKKAYQDTCDHHKESKKCDCTFCEVFDAKTPRVQKNNQTRNRLRIRLNQRNQKVSKKAAPPKIVPDAKTEPAGVTCSKLQPLAKDEASQTSRSMNDISGLLSYIEGNGNNDKMAVAEKKAAKKARQRDKKEQERLKLEEEERKRLEEEQRKVNAERRRNEELARELAEQAAKISKKETKKKKQKLRRELAKNSLIEETIPAMVTIKKVVENANATVTITLKGSTPDQDKLLYTLVNGHDDVDPVQNNNKKNKKKKSPNSNEPAGQVINLQVNSSNKNRENTSKELRVTLNMDPAPVEPKKTKNEKNQAKQKDAKARRTNDKERSEDLNLSMLRLPPGITITKVDGLMSDRNYKTPIENPSYSPNIPVSKSGVIVVDTEKLIKQSSGAAPSKKSRKKRSKKPTVEPAPAPSMVTLKNPIFQNMSMGRGEGPGGDPGCQQAAIFKNENGMVTIRSSRLQQSLANGAPMPSLLSELKPVLGPEVPSTFMFSSNFSETARISPFNAQEILSGLPGIEITKVDKNTARGGDAKKAHTAEVSIIPANNGDKFNFDKDDLHYDNVFNPKDILEDDMDAEERELEAFKRFCQQSVPPKRKEKVAHLNVKDIVLKKKNDKVSV